MKAYRKLTKPTKKKKKTEKMKTEVYKKHNELS